MTHDWTALREKAEKAQNQSALDVDKWYTAEEIQGGYIAETDYEFVVAADPQTVLVLLDENERLRAELDALSASNPRQMEAVKRLAGAGARLALIERDDARQRAEKAEAAVDCVRALHQPIAAKYCRCHEPIPCSTIRALDGGE